MTTTNTNGQTTLEQLFDSLMAKMDGKPCGTNGEGPCLAG